MLNQKPWSILDFFISHTIHATTVGHALSSFTRSFAVAFQLTSLCPRLLPCSLFPTSSCTGTFKMYVTSLLEVPKGFSSHCESKTPSPGTPGLPHSGCLSPSPPPAQPSGVPALPAPRRARSGLQTCALALLPARKALPPESVLHFFQDSASNVFLLVGSSVATPCERTAPPCTLSPLTCLSRPHGHLSPPDILPIGSLYIICCTSRRI